MSIRFAAARPATTAHFGRRPQRMGAFRPANDNESGIANPDLLRAALQHFARHGLAAAEQARAEAERAFFAGDRPAYRHWLAVCRALDRRLASRLDERITKACP